MYTVFDASFITRIFELEKRYPVKNMKFDLRFRIRVNSAVAVQCEVLVNSWTKLLSFF